EAHRIESHNVAHVHVRDIARSQVKVLLYCISNDERIRHTQALQLLGELLDLGCFSSDILEYHQAILTNDLRQNGAHTCAINLFIHFLCIVLRACFEGYATCSPSWRTGATSMRTAA